MNPYVPPKKWQASTAGGEFASINRAESGATHTQTLPIGEHPLQLYSMGTPNGVKVTILLEELLALGIAAAEYDAHYIDILKGDQFSSGFVAGNPNSKIPLLIDHSSQPPQAIFESGAILLTLAERFGQFMGSNRAELLSWLFWQVGSAPFVGGGFGHFYAYAPEKLAYPINRYSMETKRQLHLLDQHLSRNEYILGSEYSIADMAIWPWYAGVVLNRLYNAAEFLDADSYPDLQRWAKQVDRRPAVKRGVRVNTTWGEQPIKERHQAQDIND